MIRIARFATLLVLAFTSVSHAQHVINGDRGGRIGTYVEKYQDLRSSGEIVVVDGLCASACTIVLGALPPERIFFTPRAVFGFHAAWDFGPRGRAVTNREATEMLYSMYPTPVRNWIAARGGLRSKMVFMKARTIAAMGYRKYRPQGSYASAQPR